MKKNNYEAPEAELFVVRFEGNLCQSYGPNGIQRGRNVAPTWDEWEDDNN